MCRLKWLHLGSTLSRKVKARPYACLLAANAMSQRPLDLDLTDGKRPHLLRLMGDLLPVYEACTPT